VKTGFLQSSLSFRGLEVFCFAKNVFSMRPSQNQTLRKIWALVVPALFTLLMTCHGTQVSDPEQYTNGNC
jgi:hypothetical protein